MIKQIKYITLAVISLSVMSCEDFLNREPLSNLTDEMLGVDPTAVTDSVKYNTREQAEALINSAYYSFQNEYYQLDRFLINDGQSDNCYSGEPKAQTTQIDQLSIDATNGNVSRDWRYMFEQVAKANTILEWIPQNTDPSFTADRKKEIIGEAAFIRATAYFNLVRIYGDVPLILKEVPAISNANLDEVYPLLYPDRKSKDSVYLQIIEDLELSIANCMDFSANKFVITKPLAHAVLAEVYSTYNAPENTNWEKVKEHASAVTSNANYSLMPNFDDLWKAAPDESGNAYEHSVETLFEVECSSWQTIGNWSYQMFYGTDWKKFNTPSHDLVDVFTSTGDTKRYQSSIKYEDVTGVWSDQFWTSDNYPFIYKQRVNEKGNLMLWRIASSILLLAEAENELGNIAAAQAQLNRIRTRAGLANTTATTKEDLRLAIETERRLELAFEGYRWFDLVRTGRAIPVMQSCSDHQSTYGARLTESRLIWPIPQTELDQNELLTQNEGY